MYFSVCVPYLKIRKTKPKKKKKIIIIIILSVCMNFDIKHEQSTNENNK